MDLSTAETIQSQSNLMSFQFSQQIISEMTNIILQAKTQFGNLSDPEFTSLVVQGIVHYVEVLVEKERIISERHADESDQRDESRDVCDKGIQVSEENLSIDRPVVPIQQLRPSQQPNNHFKKNEHQNIKEKIENSTKPANLSSGPIELKYKTAEYVSTCKPPNNHVGLEDPSVFAGNDLIGETTRSVHQGSLKPSASFSRSPLSHSASQRLKVNEVQKIISSKQEQVRKAAEQASTHAKLAENFCYLAKQFANKAIKSSVQDLGGVAQEIKSKTLNFQMQAQAQAQNTRKEALHCNQVVKEIRDLLDIISFDEQISSQTAIRLTKMILKVLKDGEELARSASKRKDFASHFAEIASSYAEKAKSAIRTLEQSLARSSSNNRHPQEVLSFKKRIKGSQQDEKKLMDLQYQLSQHRLKMKRASLSLQKQQ